MIALVADNAGTGNFNAAFLYQLPGPVGLGGTLVNQNFGTAPALEACINGTTVVLRVDRDRDGAYEATTAGTTTLTAAGLVGLAAKSDSAAVANLPRLDDYCLTP